MAVGRSRSQTIILCLVAGLSLLILPAREFGQREHLLAIAVLPYLALASRRVGPERCSAGLVALIIGIVAGVGVALKPYFAAVPILVELFVQILSRRQARLLRAENVGMGLVAATYAIELLAFEQPYLQQAVPLAREIYWSFDLPWKQVVDPLRLHLLPAAPFVAYAFARRDGTGIILSAALFGVIASYLIQHKGYPYHLLPISIFSSVLLANFATSGGALVRTLAVICLSMLTFVCHRPVIGWWNDNRPGGARALEIDRIRSSIAAHADNGGFLIVSVHPYPSFPAAIYTPARYVSRTNSHWFLPAVAQIRAKTAQYRDRAAIERHARDFILHDLASGPDLVMIDTDAGRHTVGPKQFDILAFYQEDPAFRSIWTHYREIERISGYRQFVRVDPLPPGGPTK
ncbi:hypothetical protein LVY65_06965 [Sphingomonas sp. G124]|uniref:Uncharacterized protein n=1 Tax=Sphingomonas cremea TaxID=2904799 RepID=A0A9X1QMM0_9SPHN|nr:hypothetical protein [Sphingomonas cremea]MCF2514802.1 hypothetical protein [Sphingomonas cremea]